MIRRAFAVSALVCSLTAAGACSTFTDSDVAARVGDATLTQDELDTLLVAWAGDPADDGDDARVEVPANEARNLIQTWVLTRLIVDDIETTGGSVSDSDRQKALATIEANPNFGEGWADNTAPELVELFVEQQAAVTVWSELPVEGADDAELADRYALGPTESGITCVAHILVETEEQAEALLAELDAGADFAELAAEHSLDQGSAANGGTYPCVTTAEFSQTYVQPFVDAALGAEVGVPSEPAQSDFGYHIVLVRPFEDVRDEVAALSGPDPSVRFQAIVDASDVTVDPRYGAFDPGAGIVPLG